MRIARLTATLAMLTLAAACATERVVAPERIANPVGLSAKAVQLPLLYVVDGVRVPRNQVPAITLSEVESYVIIKGSAALKRFGPDASYGAILITTRQPSVKQ